MVKAAAKNTKKQQQNNNTTSDEIIDCESDEYSFSSDDVAAESDIAAVAPTKQVKFLEKDEHHHHQHQKSQQQIMKKQLSSSSNNNALRGNSFTGAATSSQLSSSEGGAPSILDIGSDKMPLRFFPDQRTTSGWRGVIRPTGGGMIGYHHLKNQIARNQQHHDHQQPKLSPSVTSKNIASQGSVAKSTVISNFVGNTNSNNNTPLKQTQTRANTPSLSPNNNFSSAARSNTPSSLSRISLPPMLHNQYSSPSHSSSSSHHNNNKSVNSHNQGPKRSLTKDHLTVMNTFKAPDPVPNHHKHRNANMLQESITKALPTPKSDVDVAVLAPRSRKFMSAANSGKYQNFSAVSGKDLSVTHGISPSQQASSNSAASTNVIMMSDIITDVRLVILDDIHHNLHRTVSRQLECSPQRLPRKQQQQQTKKQISSPSKKLVRTSSSVTFNNSASSEHFSSSHEDENVNNNNQSKTSILIHQQLKPSSPTLQQQKRHSQSHYVDDSDDDEQQQALLLAASRTSNKNNTKDPKYPPNYDPIGDFVVGCTSDDEKVIVGGDVIGGSAPLLPKMRGRWDAMRDAIKARYFGKEPPPPEPISHALRHLPLPELCSMYRRAVKEVKGALEMTRRIFDSLVAVMMRALPGNPSVTEEEITTMYYVFDMNGNGSISFIEFLTTVVDFQTDRRETDFLRRVFNNLLLASGQKEAVDTEDLSARAPWVLLEDVQVLFVAVLKALKKSDRFPRVVEKTFCDVLASSMTQARQETESALCQESYDGLFWEQFRLLVCLDSELMIPLRTIKFVES